MLSRGFVTIATGKMQYYEIARNLLRSYRYYSKSPYPFAIIAEEENQYTKEFNDVIILKNTERSFTDKLSVFENLPYDETIFIESDCLAYDDLNKYFDLFKGGRDCFSVFAYCKPIDAKDGWFLAEETGRYREKLHFNILQHSAIMYMRRSEELLQFNQVVQDIRQNYDEFNIGNSRDALDDKVIALSMSVCNCRPIDAGQEVMLVYPVYKMRYKHNLQRKVTVNMRKNILSAGEVCPKVMCCHFGSQFTTKPLYKREICVLEKLINNSDGIIDFRYSWLTLTNPLSEGKTNFINRIEEAIINGKIKKILMPIKKPLLAIWNKLN